MSSGGKSKEEPAQGQRMIDELLHWPVQWLQRLCLCTSLSVKAKLQLKYYCHDFIFLTHIILFRQVEMLEIFFTCLDSFHCDTSILQRRHSACY